MKKRKILIVLLLLSIAFGAYYLVSKVNNNQISSARDSEFAWEEEIIYMVMTDRFFDGDESNNNPSNIEGSYDINHLEAYHGGDFRGIIEKIDYLKDLGITTLWITPIVKNIEDNMRQEQNDKQFAYHGYWAEDFTELDPHLGSEEDLKELIDLLHENDIKLMVDVVLNHPGYNTEDEKAFENMLRGEPGAGDEKMFLSGLPDFKTEEEKVRNKLIEWQVSWLEKLITDKGNTIDYFRVDTVKHVDKETWVDFKSKLIEKDPNFKLIGENFGASIFMDGGYLSSDMMDSLLDFEFKDIAKDFTRGKNSEAELKLVKRNEAMTDGKMMGQFLSSHDEHGFLEMKLGGNVDEFLPAVSLQMTAKGQPVIYYGEELGMSGQKDNFDNGIHSENRYQFDWDLVENNHIRDHYKKLIEIRRNYSDIFANGDRDTILTEDNLTIFSRTYDGQSIFVAINTSEVDKTIEIDLGDEGKSYIDLYNKQSITKNEGKINITIPANKEGGTAILIEDNN